MFSQLRQSTVAGEAPTQQSSDGSPRDEMPMFTSGDNSASSPGNSGFDITAFERRPISGSLVAAKICLILAMGLLAFPREIDSSDPQALLWIVTADFWVWPLWLASMVAYSAILLIAGRGYDDFFANRYIFDRASSAWIRIRTSTNPVGENLRHAVITGIFVTASCFIEIEMVLTSCLFFRNLWVIDTAIEEGDQQAQEKMSWLAHLGLLFILASLPVFFCRVSIRRSLELYRIGTEARSDRIENEVERGRLNELRLREPLDAYVTESGPFSFMISPRNTSVLPPGTSDISAPAELGDLPRRPTKRVTKTERHDRTTRRTNRSREEHAGETNGRHARVLPGSYGTI